MPGQKAHRPACSGGLIRSKGNPPAFAGGFPFLAGVSGAVSVIPHSPLSVCVPTIPP